MRREINRENRERQGQADPIYLKGTNNQIQYAQSPLGKVHNHPSCQHTPINFHSLMQSLKVKDNGIPRFQFNK